jgi:hypothetical protein
VNSRRVRDFAGDSILIKVDNDNFCRVRQIQSVRRRIDRENVPAAFATDRDLGLKLILLRERGRSDVCADDRANQKQFFHSMLLILPRKAVEAELQHLRLVFLGFFFVLTALGVFTEELAVGIELVTPFLAVLAHNGLVVRAFLFPANN